MIVLIAAIAANGVIGQDNALPWRLPADLRRFRKLTTGHPVIMGRLTHESIGRPLPERTNIVLTRDPDYQPDGVVAAHEVEEAIDAATNAPGGEEVFVIGGEQVYRLFLPRADRMELTLVHVSPDGDAFFPAWDHEAWRPTAVDHHDGDPALDFVTLERTPVAAALST